MSVVIEYDDKVMLWYVHGYVERVGGTSLATISEDVSLVSMSSDDDESEGVLHSEGVLYSAGGIIRGCVVPR